MPSKMSVFSSPTTRKTLPMVSPSEHSTAHSCSMLFQEIVVMAPRSENVDDGEQQDPHDVDEVPVEAGHLEAEMLGRRVVTADRSQERDRQQRGTNQHVQAVQAGQREERRGERPVRGDEPERVVLV